MLQKLVKQLRQRIRVLKKGKVSKRTLKTKNAAIQMEPHNTRAMETQTEPIFIQDNKEQQALSMDLVA